MQIALPLQGRKPLVTQTRRLGQDRLPHILCCLGKPLGGLHRGKRHNMAQDQVEVGKRCVIGHDGPLMSQCLCFGCDPSYTRPTLSSNSNAASHSMAPNVTEQLAADEAGILRAAEILRAGGRVAFPTETVYGLGADATNGPAVAGIYAAKGRPSFNPLIAHVADIQTAKRYVVWSDLADRVAEAFWPGPLTLVLPLREGSGISELVTAGLDTLAVRVPAHPLAQALWRALDRPLAALSANPSGRISPTTPDHVLAGLDGQIEAVLMGGPCEVGVESTILGLAGDPVLLRPGGLPVEALEAMLGGPIATGDNAEAPRAHRASYCRITRPRRA